MKKILIASAISLASLGVIFGLSNNLKLNATDDDKIIYVGKEETPSLTDDYIIKDDINDVTSVEDNEGNNIFNPKPEEIEEDVLIDSTVDFGNGEADPYKKYREEFDFYASRIDLNIYTPNYDLYLEYRLQGMSPSQAFGKSTDVDYQAGILQGFENMNSDEAKEFYKDFFDNTVKDENFIETLKGIAEEFGDFLKSLF